MIKLLDKFVPASTVMVKKAFDMADLKAGENHVELGSGDGRFVVEALQRGASSVGYEFDAPLAIKSMQKNNIHIYIDDAFNADVSNADVVTCWFTKLPETQELMDKLLAEMKDGARLVKGGKTPHRWQPKEIVFIDNNWLCLYVKDQSWL